MRKFNERVGSTNCKARSAMEVHSASDEQDGRVSLPVGPSDYGRVAADPPVLSAEGFTPRSSLRLITLDSLIRTGDVQYPGS